MASLASRENRLARLRSVPTPNSGLGTLPKEAQKVSPWKNYLAETKPPTGFFARPGVSPCGSHSDTPFLPRSSHQPGRLQPRQSTLLDPVKKFLPLLLAQFDSLQFHRPSPSRPNRTSPLCANRTFSLCAGSFTSASCYAGALPGRLLPS